MFDEKNHLGLVFRAFDVDLARYDRASAVFGAIVRLYVVDDAHERHSLLLHALCDQVQLVQISCNSV